MGGRWFIKRNLRIHTSEIFVLSKLGCNLWLYVMNEWMYVCMYVCMCVCMYVCMYVCVYVCMYVCVYVCMYVCMYRYVCIGMYVCVYVCMWLISFHLKFQCYKLKVNCRRFSMHDQAFSKDNHYSHRRLLLTTFVFLAKFFLRRCILVIWSDAENSSFTFICRDIFWQHQFIVKISYTYINS